MLPVMTTVAIALKDEDQDFIQEAVNSGRFL
jgi:Arc/MetJ-type ribon-helix-helix transcriptional regulator